jgi:hypothetical protein
MLFLLLAFLQGPHLVTTGCKSLIKPKTAFFLFWILARARSARKFCFHHPEPLRLRCSLHIS